MIKNENDQNPIKPMKPNHIAPLLTAWLIALFTVIAYVGSEWLFVVTKPSFMSQAPLIEKTTIPVFSIALLTLLVWLIQSVLLLVVRKTFDTKLWGSRLMMVLPSIILASTILLLVDNLTYITMSVGIITSRGFVRILYALGFMAVVVYLIFDLAKLHKVFIKTFDGRKPQKNKKCLIAILSLTIIIVVAGFVFGLLQRTRESLGTSTLSNKKNVILITADGLEARYMSVYGSEKETTPFLDSLKSQALIARNHFSNSGNTAGSIASLLTGKYPSTTRVLYRPDILQGDDSYQSLPAILKRSSYYCAQESYDYYADAFKLNFKDAFDYVNGRGAKSTQLLGIKKLPLPTNFEYFLYELQARLMPRLSHIFLLNVMQNQFEQMTGKTEVSDEFGDQEKMAWAADILAESERPVFLHIHWMSTHGPKYTPQNRVFSRDLDINQQSDWDIPFYEDAILDFDNAIKQLYAELDALGVLDETLIIIGSDHAMHFVTTNRIPLMMIFPNAEYSGEIIVDTQNLDIAPTILDYLGADIPDWMAGESLLSPIQTYRPIIGTQLKHTFGGGETLIINDEFSNPPFYQFDLMGVQNCGTWLELDLETYEWNILPVIDYVSDCKSQDIIDLDMFYEAIIDRLKADGFEFDESQIPRPKGDL